MSHPEELKRFENDLKNNEELQKKLDETVKRIVAVDQAQSDGEVMAAAAKELGYDVSVTALEQAWAEAETMDPEALAAVAGGVEYHDKEACPENQNFICVTNFRSSSEDAEGHADWCYVTWHCLAALRHTNTADDSDVCCWSDYLCVLAYHKKC